MTSQDAPQTPFNAGQASRTCYCGEIRAKDAGRVVVLKGWAHYRRDHGGLIFVDLRDREGLAQIVFDPDQLSAERFQTAHGLKSEDVLAIRGKVRLRPEGSANPNLKTGEVEVLIDAFEVLAPSRPLPFQVNEHTHATEDLRLRYRYLDLRRTEMRDNILARAKLFQTVRRFLDGEGLIEVDTPILTRSTPEGARDFLVPSRMNPGTFYALPQSPQLFKQILMVAGFDRYYQISRCFRDEDLRANRQPEFTQIDIELSFVTPEDIFKLIEAMMVTIYRDLKAVEVTPPFPRLKYADAMVRFGSDKPDLRFDLEIEDVTEVFSTGCNFKVFNAQLERGAVARALRVPGAGSQYSNTQLKPGGELPEVAARYGAKGLAWFRAEEDPGSDCPALNSSIAKFFEADCLKRLGEATGARPGDLILIVVDEAATAGAAMGQLRLHIGRELKLIDTSRNEFCWITDFPLLEYDKTEKRWTALHHPFTAPHPGDLEFLESDPGRVRSLGYDLTLNGEEIGGGSIRIHQRELQERVFSLLGISSEAAQEKFGFLLEALTYGAPPHGGIAFGLDRILMLLQGTDSIRDVIPFPKTQSGTDLMTQAPGAVDPSQLKELGLRLVPRPGKVTGQAKQEGSASGRSEPDEIQAAKK